MSDFRGDLPVYNYLDTAAFTDGVRTRKADLNLTEQKQIQRELQKHGCWFCRFKARLKLKKLNGINLSE